MQHEGIDIPLDNLTPESAARLRWLFESSAAASRLSGDQAAEAVLIGLAGLLDTVTKARAEATGEPLPEPLEVDPMAGAVDLRKLSARDALDGANALVAVSERADKAGRRALSDAIASTAEQYMNAARDKANIGRTDLVQ